MTLHNSKGMEFELVFLVGMEEDLLPHVNSRGDEKAIEEERRLCYVGMTRAKKHLYLCSTSSRYMWGTQRLMRPSRFLKEIPPQYLEKVYNSSY
jgi:DNA helicase-2/ATP-dependent DNA helicase PcrA